MLSMVDLINLYPRFPVMKWSTISSTQHLSLLLRLKIFPSIVLVLGTLAYLPSALAEEPKNSAPMSLESVIQQVISANPDLAVIAMKQDIAANNRAKIEGMLDPSYSVTAGISDEKKPTTSPFAATGTNSSRIQGQITQPLADGSSLSGQWSYARNHQQYPNTMPTAFLPSVNPAYSNQIDLIYRYPILQGRNKPTYHFQAEALDADIKTSRATIELQKEALVNQSVAAFFQLAIDQINVEIAQSASLRTKKLLTYQKKRQEFGLIEEADLLQTKALQEKTRFNLQQARSILSNDKVLLNRLMLRDHNAPLSIRIPNNLEQWLEKQSLNELIRTGLSRRAIFKSVDARMKAAEARLSMVEDEEKMRLDVTGQIGTRALEASQGQAFTNGFRVRDRFIGINLELSDTIGDHTSKANVQKAILDIEELKLTNIQAKESVKTEISTAYNTLQQSRNQLSAAYRQSESEQQKYDSELERYRQGRTDLSTVIQFENDLNNAHLITALQRIQVQMSAARVLVAAGLLTTSGIESNETSKP